MKNVVIAGGIVVVLTAFIVGFFMFNRQSIDIRTQQLITNLMCDPILQQKIEAAYRHKKPKRFSMAAHKRQPFWLWAVNLVSQRMLAQRVAPDALAKQLGQQGEHYRTLSRIIATRVKTQCGAQNKTRMRKAKVAIVWELLASYANVPSPVPQHTVPPRPRPTRLFRQPTKTRLTPQDKARVELDTQKVVRQLSWVYRKFSPKQEKQRFKHMQAVMYYTDKLRHSPSDLYVRYQLGQSYLLIGQFKKGVTILKTTVTLCSKRIKRNPKDVQSYITRAGAQAAMAEYHLAVYNIKLAIFWAKRRKQTKQWPGLQMLLHIYKRGQENLHKAKGM